MHPRAYLALKGQTLSAVIKSVLPRPAPRHLQISAGAMLPITAVQFGMNRFLEQTYRSVMGVEQLDTGGRVAVAMGAGASSALLGCPAE